MIGQDCRSSAPVYFRPMKMRRTRFLTPLALAALAVLGGLIPAAAQTPSSTVYTIELIVFRNQSGAGGAEDWSVKPQARRPDQPDSPVTGRFVAAVPAAQFQLTDVAAKLRNSSNYQPIAHFAWQQTASSWGSGAGFTVAKLGGNVPGLSGIIFLEAGTYLHLGMTLNYQTSNPPAGLGAAPGQVFTMSESRRIKRYERNYYDHPAFGVIALVTPANKPTGGR
jgi:Peptidoglycan-binding protein, CsiV